MSTLNAVSSTGEPIASQRNEKITMPSYAKPLALLILGLALIGAADYFGFTNLSFGTVTTVATFGLASSLVGMGLLFIKKGNAFAKIALISILVTSLLWLLIIGIRTDGQYLECFKEGLHNIDWQQWFYPIGGILGAVATMTGVFYMFKTKLKRDSIVQVNPHQV